MIKNKNIFIPGGRGSIGEEVVRQLAPYNRIFILDIDEDVFNLVEEMKLKGYDVDGRVGSILDKEMLDKVRTLFGSPDWIFNCAARKYVTPMQDTPLEAINVNCIGTLNLLEFSKKYNSKFICVSSDKAVNTESVMGWSKRGAEILTKIYGGIIVRFGNVLGSKGSVIPIWQKQISNNEPLTVTDERMTRYMMTIPEAVSLIIEAAEIGIPKDTLIMKMGNPINILELAQKILKESRSNVGIKMIGTREGESLEERLMTQEEEKRAVETDKFYIIHG